MARYGYAHLGRRSRPRPTDMTTTSPTSTYALGSTEAEHERLFRQAAILAPFTERLFRDAGIRLEQCILDIGSRLGDITMLAARLVFRQGP